jgi:hypothetical protein
VADRSRAYYQAHRAELADRSRAYYQAHRAELADRSRAYRQAHRAEVAANDVERISANLTKHGIAKNQDEALRYAKNYLGIA